MPGTVNKFGASDTEYVFFADESGRYQADYYHQLQLSLVVTLGSAQKGEGSRTSENKARSMTDGNSWRYQLHIVRGLGGVSVHPPRILPDQRYFMYFGVLFKIKHVNIESFGINTLFWGIFTQKWLKTCDFWDSFIIFLC